MRVDKKVYLSTANNPMLRKKIKDKAKQKKNISTNIIFVNDISRADVVIVAGEKDENVLNEITNAKSANIPIIETSEDLTVDDGDVMEKIFDFEKEEVDKKLKALKQDESFDLER